MVEPKTELQRNAIYDARRKEQQIYQRALDMQYLNNRVEGTQIGRCLALIQQETKMEKEFMERRDHAAIVNARARKEIALGIEIAKKSREDACQLMRRQYIRERDPELRDMVRKLQGAYVRKDLEQQILQNQYRKMQDKIEEAAANRILVEAIATTAEEEERREMDKKREYLYELQQQLVNKEQQRHCEYEDRLIEKKMMEDIMRTMADEDQSELKHKQEQIAKMRHEMTVFQQARAAWREKQRAVVREEEKKVRAQEKLVAARADAVASSQAKKDQIREELNKKITDQMAAEKAARDERADLIRQLQEQEYLEKGVQDHIRELTDLANNKSRTRSSLLAQMQHRKDEELKRRVRDERYKQQVQEKLDADEEKERKKKESTKERNKKYSLELKKQIQLNEEKRAADKRDDEKRAEYVTRFLDNWDAEARVEAERITSEHAAILQRGEGPQAPPPARSRGPPCRQNAFQF